MALRAGVPDARHSQRTLTGLDRRRGRQDRRELAFQLPQVRCVEEQVHGQLKGVALLAVRLPVAGHVLVGEQEESPRPVAGAAQLRPLLPFVLEDGVDRVLGGEGLQTDVRVGLRRVNVLQQTFHRGGEVRAVVARLGQDRAAALKVLAELEHLRLGVIPFLRTGEEEDRCLDV